VFCNPSRKRLRRALLVMQEDDRVTPSTLTMNRTDVLEFQNNSGGIMRIVFVYPHDQADKIRCYLTDHTIARPDQTPWLLFDWGPGRRLTAIPPGKFASACSLAPASTRSSPSASLAIRAMSRTRSGRRARSPSSRTGDAETRRNRVVELDAVTLHRCGRNGRPAHDAFLG